MRYRCVDAQKATGFPVAAACQAAGVTRSAYYAWTTRATQGPSDHDREEVRLVAEVRRIHARSGGTYGVPRVHAELRRRGWTVNHKRVERLWRREGLKVPAKQPKRGRLWLNDGSCVRLADAELDKAILREAAQGNY